LEQCQALVLRAFFVKIVEINAVVMLSAAAVVRILAVKGVLL